MKKRWIGLLLAGILAVTSLTACGSSNSAESEEETTEEEEKTTEEEGDDESSSLTGEGLNEADSVTIGYIGTTTIAVLADQVYDILQNNLGDSVTVSYEKFESGPDAITALATDSLDILISVGTLPIVTAGSNGTEFKVISTSGTAVDTYFVVPEGSDVESLSDVAGLKIGVPLGTMSQYALLSKLDEYGVSVEDVELINLSGQDLITAFSGGEVDVMVNSTTLCDPLIAEGEAILIEEADPSPKWVLGNETYLEENPEIVAEVLAYYEDVFDYIAAGEDTVLDEIGENFEIETDTVKTTYDTYGKSFLAGVGEDEVSELENVLQFALDNELITEEFDIDSYIDTVYVQEAIVLAAE